MNPNPVHLALKAIILDELGEWMGKAAADQGTFDPYFAGNGVSSVTNAADRTPAQQRAVGITGEPTVFNPSGPQGLPNLPPPPTAAMVRGRGGPTAYGPGGAAPLATPYGRNAPMNTRGHAPATGPGTSSPWGQAQPAAGSNRVTSFGVTAPNAPGKYNELPGMPGFKGATPGSSTAAPALPADFQRGAANATHQQNIRGMQQQGLDARHAGKTLAPAAPTAVFSANGGSMGIGGQQVKLTGPSSMMQGKYGGGFATFGPNAKAVASNGPGTAAGPVGLPSVATAMKTQSNAPTSMASAAPPSGNPANPFGTARGLTSAPGSTMSGPASAGPIGKPRDPGQMGTDAAVAPVNAAIAARPPGSRFDPNAMNTGIAKRANILRDFAQYLSL